MIFLTRCWNIRVTNRSMTTAGSGKTVFIVSSSRRTVSSKEKNTFSIHSLFKRVTNFRNWYCLSKQLVSVPLHTVMISLFTLAHTHSLHSLEILSLLKLLPSLEVTRTSLCPTFPYFSPPRLYSSSFSLVNSITSKRVNYVRGSTRRCRHFNVMLVLLSTHVLSPCDRKVEVSKKMGRDEM